MRGRWHGLCPLGDRQFLVSRVWEKEVSQGERPGGGRGYPRVPPRSQPEAPQAKRDVEINLSTRYQSTCEPDL